MKSLLYSSGFEVPAVCQVGTRTEVPVSIPAFGRVYRFVARDQIAPEDPYLVMVRAAAHAIMTQEPYGGTPPGRDVKDFLVKSTLET